MANPGRAYDLVVWGGSGFTGRLAAEYLARRYTPGGSVGVGSVAATEPVRWAIAGRDRVKLEKVRDEIEQKHPHARNKIDVLVGSLDDPQSLLRVASSTNTLLTFAGPFALHGMPVVDACVTCGTDYCDITGEPTFIRDVIDKHESNLVNGDGTSPCIVNCVGYDSVPWDLGAWAVTKYLKQKHDATCYEAFGHTGKSKGGVSGGTIASALHLMANTPMATMKRMGSPHFLTKNEQGPSDNDTKKRWATQSGAMYDEDLKRWTMPSVMAGINTKVVARSAELNSTVFSKKKFAYNESDACSSKWNAFVGTAVVGLFGALLLFPPTRWLLARFLLPKPGEGPDEKLRETGFGNVYVVGSGVSANSKHEKKKAVAHFAFTKADPGYKGTAALAVEAALCLALPHERCKTPGALRGGGVLTPSTAMGNVLVDRINKSDLLRFSVGELGEKELRV